ncbi:hypothetical protein [Nonomuraea sp. NPDC049607]|uniref:hypothetical protein n=1 Tax=unclassified Nonomuraea TaxID=2593643 RepID=UPI00341D09B3
MSLESSREGVDVIARRCGFGTAETMRRASSGIGDDVDPVDWVERLDEGVRGCRQAGHAP